MAARASSPLPVLAAALPADGWADRGMMSYCAMATCIAHRRSVYVDIPAMEWVHADGWPCDAMLYALISPLDLE